nr:putative electron transfer flavoprotein FixB [Salmonella sp. NCTC 7297]
MSKFFSVWVFSDTPSRLAELMGGAQHTGEQINVFVLSEADSEVAFHFGADRVWLVRGKPDDRMVEDYAEAMAETLHKHGGEAGMVLLPNTRRGKLLAAKLGYRLAAAVSNDASSVVPQAEGAAVKHMVYGGLAMGRRDDYLALGGRHAEQRRF